MELRHLRYFIAVAESLHFGQAATKLEIAQPSLSHQIRQLEAELETSLLHRTKRRVELTDAGRLFLEEARDIIARADRAAVVTRRAGRGEAIRLRVGIGYCMDHMEASKTVGVFKRIHDAVHVQLHTMSAGAQITALNEGRLDIGFVRPPLSDLSLVGEVLVREPFAAAVHAAHPIARRHQIALSQLASEAFVLPPRNSVPLYHDLVLRACRQAGFIPNVTHEADHLLLMLGTVAAGAGVALVPASSRKIRQSRVALVRLHPSHAILETVVTRRRDDASPFVEEFLRVARKVMGHRDGLARSSSP